MVDAIRTNLVSFPKLGLSFKMREAVNIFGMDIYWYGIIIGLGMITAIAIAFYEFKKKGLKSDDLVDFVIFAIPLGIVGARLYYVIFEWDLFKDPDFFKQLYNIIALWEGGLGIYGGVIMGAVVAIIFCKIKKISFLWFADLGTIGLFIAQSIGRWGNFVNGEAYGSKTDLPWGMMVNGSGPWSPTFLYESLWNLVGFAVSYFVIYKMLKTDGFSFAFYLIWYGVGRFWIEALRTDSLFIIKDVLKASQVVAVISIIIGIGVLWYIKKYAKCEIDTEKIQ